MTRRSKLFFELSMFDLVDVIIVIVGESQLHSNCASTPRDLNMLTE